MVGLALRDLAADEVLGRGHRQLDRRGDDGVRVPTANRRDLVAGDAVRAILHQRSRHHLVPPVPAAGWPGDLWLRPLVTLLQRRR